MVGDSGNGMEQVIVQIPYCQCAGRLAPIVKGNREVLQAVCKPWQHHFGLVPIACRTAGKEQESIVGNTAQELVAASGNHMRGEGGIAAVPVVAPTTRQIANSRRRHGCHLLKVFVIGQCYPAAVEHPDHPYSGIGTEVVAHRQGDGVDATSAIYLLEEIADSAIARQRRVPTHGQSIL